VRLFYEDATRSDKSKARLVRVDVGATLKQILSDPRYMVMGGTPGFIVLAEGSEFAGDFLKKYELQ
jgi:hypothetical protein